MLQDKSDLIEQLEIELLQPDVRRSTRRLDELLANNFIEFTSIGVTCNKKDIMDRLPRLTKTKWTTHNFKVNVLSQELVLVTYKVEKHVLETNVKTNSLRSSL